MRAKTQNHVARLQMGHYLLEVDQNGHAYTIPITSGESQQIIKKILGRC